MWRSLLSRTSAVASHARRSRRLFSSAPSPSPSAARFPFASSAAATMSDSSSSSAPAAPAAIDTSSTLAPGEGPVYPLRDAFGAPALESIPRITRSPLTTTSSHSQALRFEVLATEKRARAAIMTLPHGPVETPVFMPVGTQGTIKGLTSEQVSSLGNQIILGNTYHLALRPGADLVAHMGGLHRFMNWKGNLLTDSGGFQMVSLIELARIDEVGVQFQSPVDGSAMLLTPERSIRLQNQIGADIMMALDDVVSSLETDKDRVEEAMHRTIRWIDRCIVAHERPAEQNLFGIVQGGLDPKLRDICLDAMIARSDWLPGYAIGGLAGGEDKHEFWRVVSQCCKKLPPGKPRYLMGVGYPIDLLVCTALGVDMYDCVWPCRTARFGSAIVSTGLVQLKRAQYANDPLPLDPECSCLVCKKYSRAYLASLFGQSPLAAQLVTYHNLHFMKRYMSAMRDSILQGRFEQFANDTLERLYPRADYPSWVVDALNDAGVVFRHQPQQSTAEEERRRREEAQAAQGHSVDQSYQVKKSHQRQRAKTAEEREAERADKKRKKKERKQNRAAAQQAAGTQEGSAPSAASDGAASPASTEEPPTKKAKTDA